jgi:hypothetical protein
MQWVESSSTTTSTSITTTIPTIISSHRRTSVRKVTIRPSSSSLYFWQERVHTPCCPLISSWFTWPHCGVVLRARFFYKEYHVEGSRLQKFAWFRRKQELHFVHHRHANTNFTVVHFFWGRILGTYRSPNAALARQSSASCSEKETRRQVSRRQLVNPRLDSR